MDRLITFAIILVLASVLKADQNCHLSELWQCQEIVNERLNSLPKHSLPHTTEQVSQLCGILQESTHCVQNYTDNCMTPIQKELMDIFIDGMVVTQGGICNPETDMHKNYMKHAKCLNNVLELNAVKDELEYVVVVMKKAEAAPNKKLPYYCCPYSQTNNTFSNEVRKNCGVDAIYALENIIDMVFAQLPDVVCNTFKANDDQCKNVLPPEDAKDY